MKIKLTKGRMSTYLNEGNRFCMHDRSLALAVIKQMLRMGWTISGKLS